MTKVDGRQGSRSAAARCYGAKHARYSNGVQQGLPNAEGQGFADCRLHSSRYVGIRSALVIVTGRNLRYERLLATIQALVQELCDALRSRCSDDEVLMQDALALRPPRSPRDGHVLRLLYPPFGSDQRYET